MSASRVLQLSALLLGLCEAHGASPAGNHFPSQKVPVSHLRMLTLGLAHLLQGVEENVQRLEQEGELVGAELDGATKSLESLRTQNIQTGRTHRQVRKDLQIHTARRDRLWKVIRDLLKELEDLQSEQEALQHRMNRITQSVKSLKTPNPGGQTHSETSSIQVLINKQARRLANLTFEVSAQERTLNRRLQQIEHLEKRLSSDMILWSTTVTLAVAVEVMVPQEVVLKRSMKQEGILRYSVLKGGMQGICGNVCDLHTDEGA